MRLNKFSFLLIPMMCLSMISCSASENIDEIDPSIHEVYKLFSASIGNDLYKESMKSVVSILTLENDEAASIGSGFIYAQTDEHQYIITNHHVVEDMEQFRIISHTGQVKIAKLLGSDSVFDVALLKCRIFDDTKVASFPNEDYKLIENPKVGDEVYAIGNPGTLENYGTLAKGIVSGVDRDCFSKTSTFENADYSIQIDVTLNPGNSGGPLFNSKGEVIGINTYKVDVVNGITYSGINFALPIQDALLIIENIKKSGKFTRSTIGFNTYMNVKELTLYEKDFLNLDRDYQAGIIIKQFGDHNILDIPEYSIITAINDIEINSLAEFRRQLYFAGPNKEIKISYFEYKNSGYDFVKKDISLTTKAVNA